MRPPFRHLLALALACAAPGLAAAAAPLPAAASTAAPAPAAPSPAAPSPVAPPPAPMPHPLHPFSVITFAGGTDLPLWVAERQGYFAKQGLDVHITYTPGSIYQMSNLIAGRYDLAMTALDNVVAYDEGQGEWPVPANPDVVAVLGADDYFLSLVAQKPDTTIESLKGKTLSVDALTTGFAFVLEDLLAKHGIQPGDVKFEKKGGVLYRYLDMLKDQNDAATIQITPFDLLSEAHGMNVLARVSDALGPYMGEVAAVRRAFAVTHREEVIGFIRAYKEAIDWLYKPANRGVAAAILVAHLRSMTPPLAEQTLNILLAPKDGFIRNVTPDMDGVKLVLTLRTKYGTPHKVLDNPMKYLDLSYLNAALH
ncbi:MAG: ABC transporter substrate-binding protein [Rhodospirillales bacterium]|jgi:ABC-type nitrate/sulfonate/bicarbonate transport system substrate-binding protein|nr:ABC transporter substrate-binding protein [Rhodospirillales bacterium]